jgi:hypothetical protein
MTHSLSKKSLAICRVHHAEFRTALEAGCWRKRLISLAPIEKL